jgi:hypothetical protein
MKVSAEQGKKCHLSVGAFVIHLNGAGDPLHDVGGVRTPLHTPFFDHIEYSIDQNMDAISAELKRRGVKALPHPNGSAFRIKDPEGFDVTLLAKK